MNSKINHGFFLNAATLEQRDDLARDWKECRKAISLCHTQGLYGAASVLRTNLSQIERCISAISNKTFRRDLAQREIQSRIFRGELEVTDADGVETMMMQG